MKDALSIIGSMFSAESFVFHEAQARWFGNLGRLAGFEFLNDAEFARRNLYVVAMPSIGSIAVSLFACLVLPNSQQWIDPHSQYVDATPSKPYLRAIPPLRTQWAYYSLMGVALGLLLTMMSGPSEFLYFQF